MSRFVGCTKTEETMATKLNLGEKPSVKVEREKVARGLKAEVCTLQLMDFDTRLCGLDTTQRVQTQGEKNGIK